ncbi:hypothetical protein LTR56_008880 [Elasticomyces elasticus]|nr:hypothetical protein LTR56_008880 [Elasticomyces elasticus]KAK4914869.1 hypothetical protein LTR49_016981 [Elasticomyces elasticus]KAK5754058.1 hypothetical protein LTS12_015812 [Elasticomyces elasticus]
MPIRLTILIRKLPSISTEEFNKYWVRPQFLATSSASTLITVTFPVSDSHPSTFLSVPIVQEKLIKYQQFHASHPFSAGLKTHGLPVADYDGGAEFWAETYEDMMAVFQDPEYEKIVVPDEMKFLDREKAVMMLGWEEVKWDDHKPAAGVKVELVTR